MAEFSNRVYEKLSKLSPGQIELIFNELRSQDQMYLSIFNSLSTGIVTVDTDWHLLTLNKAAERLLPFSSSPLESKNDKIKFFEFLEDKEMNLFFKDCFECHKTNISDEFTIQTSGGSIRFIEISVTSLVQNEKLSGSIITVDDVTEKRNQEILLHRMETMAGLTNVAASVAHEIKNPLGAISIHIQLLQKAIRKKRESDGMLPDEKFTENYLEVVNQEIDRLNKIVLDFLMAVRPISAQLALVKPDEILSQFFDFITPELSEKRVKLETKLTSSSPKLLIDEKLFREVIVNLAQNSLAAIEERFNSSLKSNAFGEVTLGKLNVETWVKDEKYFLRFTDNGCGMSEEVKARVFEPYYTTKANGTGLGMAMSYKIIKEFSGDISVKSQQGEGTEFLISIPLPQTGQKLLSEKKV